MRFTKIDNLILAIPRSVLIDSVKLFYSKMVFRCNHKNKSWWKHQTLAEREGVSRNTVLRWCRKLESLGMVENRRTGRSNEMSIVPLTYDDFRRLGVPEEIIVKDMDGASDATPMVHQMQHGRCTDIIKRKDKTKKKTGGAAAGRVREKLFEIFDDEDVKASNKRAVEASKKKKRLRRIHLDIPPEVAADPEDALPDEARLGRWSSKDWSNAFVTAMNKAGFSIAFQGYRNTLPAHVGAIKDHLINRGFSRLKIYRFLLEWFPSTYPDIRSSVFRKGSEDRMFSVSWMEPRLDKLVQLFEDRNDDGSPWGSAKVTVME